MAKYRIPIQVCVFLFRQGKHGREYLLLHRVVKEGPFWQGVTGALEEGEILLQAAAREVLEETGFRPAKICSIDFKYSFPVKGEWRKSFRPGPVEIIEHVFVAEVDGRDPTLSREHEAFGWHAPGEAVRMVKWPANVEGIRRCEAFLTPS